MSEDGTISSAGEEAAADVAYRWIRQQILAGDRKGGDWLREGDLADSIGVSRTPVREALRRLTAEGLVHYERHRGVQVQAWSVHDLDEIFTLRHVLEPCGSRLAAESGRADVDALDALAAEMDEIASTSSPDLDRLTEVNNRFHQLVLEASGSSRLVAILRSVVQVPLVWRTFSHYSPPEMRRSLAHHHEIVAALAAGDPDWAESVMRSHVRAAWNSVRRSATSQQMPDHDDDR